MEESTRKEEIVKPLITVVDKIKVAQCVCGFIWNDDECIWGEEFCPRCGRKIDWGTDVVSTEAIPLTWIDKHIAWLEGLDNPFSTITALNIKVMVKQWKEENERTDKGHEDAEKLL